MDGRILERLSEQRSTNVFPSTWLYNTGRSANRLVCTHDRLLSGLAWGKPVLRSQANLNDLINHNTQIDKSLYGPEISLDFFVFHLTWLNPRQRIAANVNKLVARRYASADETAEEIASRDLSEVTDGNIIGWVSEIRRHLSVKDLPDGVMPPLRAGCLELMGDQSVTYFSETERKLVHDFVANPLTYCRTALEVQ